MTLDDISKGVKVGKGLTVLEVAKGGVIKLSGLAGSSVIVSDREFTPYYALITADIRARIASGEWPPGHQLPSTSALLAIYAAIFGVKSASTVRRAIDEMLDTGELRGHQGVGVWVAKRPPG